MTPDALDLQRELRARADEIREGLHDRWGETPHRERLVRADRDPPREPDDLFRYAAVALVRDGDRLLFLRDSSHDWQSWEPPGGRSEAGERPAETAVREVREESGVAATAEALLLTETLSFDYGGERTYPVTQAVFLADRVGGEARAAEPGIDAVAWHPLSDLPERAQFRDLLHRRVGD